MSDDPQIVEGQRVLGVVPGKPPIGEEKVPKKHKMVFVVPKKSMRTFKYQEDLSDIPQFVLCPDPVLNTMEQYKKRKRVSGEPVI